MQTQLAPSDPNHAGSSHTKRETKTFLRQTPCTQEYHGAIASRLISGGHAGGLSSRWIEALMPKFIVTMRLLSQMLNIHDVESVVHDVCVLLWRWRHLYRQIRELVTSIATMIPSLEACTSLPRKDTWTRAIYAQP